MERFLNYMKKLFDECSLPVINENISFEEIMLPTENDYKLRTMIWTNGTHEPQPTVLFRSCYPHMEAMLKLRAEEMVKRGFAVVVQWCRGINGSEGSWEPNIYDRADGLSIMNYLQKQEWVKNIGYWGDSYLAYTGWCMAEAVPEKCKTMFLGVYGCDRHVSAYKDGLFRQDILTAWAKDNAGVPIPADYMESCRFRPQIDVDEKLWGVRLNWYRDWISHTDRDCDYWSTGLWQRLKETPGKMTIPVFIKEGWYDHHLGSALATQTYLSEESAAHSTLQIGPWNHGYGFALSDQNHDNLVDDSIETPLKWFYDILVLGKTPEKRVLTYVCGADRWEEGTEYPFVPVREEKFYLDASSKACDAYKAGKEPQANSTVSYVYDPLNPVMTYGAESSFQTKEVIGSLRQPPVSYRSDVISFLSPVLEEDLNIKGKIKVKLYVSADVEDTAFTAKLMEVRSDKSTYNIRGTITTLAYRNGTPHRIEYEKGSIVEITLEMWDISWLLKKGSQLRIDIGSSDFPQYAVHPNKAGAWSLHEETVKATETIYTGKDYPSAVILPLAD